MDSIIVEYAHIIMWLIITAVILSFGFFLWHFFYRSFIVARRIEKIIKKIKQLKKTEKSFSSINSLDVSVAIEDEITKHLWSEYCDTLHIVKNNNGTEETRATIPAEVYFTEEVLVDSPLYADFYKHLPGIMTGCAIISTFAGLIKGLHSFDLRNINLAESTIVLNKVSSLIQEVGTAFVYSASAISVAMVITALEKYRIRRCHLKVEELCQAIDSLYRMGAGEEYMARLVDSSESSDANTRQLKDSLVNDLKVMMENLTEKQINSQMAQANLIGDKISSSIKTTFEPALGGLGQLVEKSTGDQSAAVQGLLQDVLAAFMIKLDDTFGAQIKGINETLTQSVKSMMLVQESLQNLIGDISKAGENATSQMAKQLEQSIAKTTESQQAVSTELKEMFGVMKEMITEQQEKSKTALDENMNLLMSRMGDSLKILEKYRETSANEESKRYQKLSEDTTALYSGFSSEIDSLVQAIKDSVVIMEKNITTISETSTYSIEQMSKGAEKINAATNGLMEGSKTLQTSTIEVNAMQKQLNAIADSLKQTVEVNNSAFKEYEKIRTSLEQYIIGLKAVVESSQKEFSNKRDLITEMDGIIKSFKAVEAETTTYLGNVSSVLQNAFKDFSSNLNTQLQESFKETDTHIGKSINALAGVAQELTMVVKKIDEKK